MKYAVTLVLEVKAHNEELAGMIAEDFICESYKRDILEWSIVDICEIKEANGEG